MKGRSITVGSETPWGRADRIEIKDNGIVFVSTPSHGGFYVPPHLNTDVPEAWRAASFNRLGVAGWYEEDCDWSIVAKVFPDLFNDDEKAAAAKTFDYWITKKL